MPLPPKNELLMPTPTPVLKWGDVVTMPLPDQRNWWQRHAPRWLGGRSATHPYGDFVITAVSSPDDPDDDR